MTPFRFLRGERGDRIDRIEARVGQMFEHDRREFDLAMGALLGDVDAREVNDEVRRTDQKVNEAEREIRRELVVHASVFGGIEIPTVLIYMSIVKDIERVGDYAKNLLDLALDGVTFEAGEDAEAWRSLAAEVSGFITEAADAFHARDHDRTRRLLTQGDRMLKDFDTRVSALVRGEDQRPNAVSRALAYRYVKRVVAHLLNVLTAVIMPIHRLDFFDEDPEDRS
jgi:phosphate uptake regulator